MGKCSRCGEKIQGVNQFGIIKTCRDYPTDTFLFCPTCYSIVFEVISHRDYKEESNEENE